MLDLPLKGVWATGWCAQTYRVTNTQSPIRESGEGKPETDALEAEP